MTTTTPTLPVDTLLKEAAWWRLERNTLVATIPNEDTGALPEFKAVIKELRQIHPHLPEAMRASILFAKKNYFNYKDCETQLHAGCITQLMKVMTGDVVEFANRFGVRVYMTNITDISIDETNHLVKLKGLQCDVDTTDVQGRNVPYIYDMSVTTTLAPITELDKRYPGWKERLDVGVGLSLDGSALMAYTFKSRTEKATTQSDPLPEFE